MKAGLWHLDNLKETIKKKEFKKLLKKVNIYD